MKGLKQQKRQVKAVGLMSGGLDSTLAAKILKDLGVDVHGVHFALPWGCGSQARTKKMAQQIGVPLKVIVADESYFNVLKKPRYGYGSAVNPCIDCHIHMIRKAAAYREEIGADFVFTGEVIGQRPMSQLKNSLRSVENNSGIKGRLLRPLCARLLDPTIPETEGLIDREKLFKISGRGRKEQRRLAKEFGITDFPNAGGGCLLTDKSFGNRLRDLFAHGGHSLEETVILKWGRHFRIHKDFKVILGRDKKECEALAAHAKLDDYLLQLEDKRGPIAILQGPKPSNEQFALAAGLIQYFSRYRGQTSRTVAYWRLGEPSCIERVPAPSLTLPDIEKIKV